MFVVFHAAHPSGAFTHCPDIGNPGSGILCSYIAAVLGIDEITHREQQRATFLAVGIADDNRLAAAKGQPRQGGFVGHAPGQAQYVVQGFRLTGVGKHPATTYRWSQCAVVDGDNRTQAAVTVAAKCDQLVLVVGRCRKNAHIIILKSIAYAICAASMKVTSCAGVSPLNCFSNWSLRRTSRSRLRSLT